MTTMFSKLKDMSSEVFGSFVNEPELFETTSSTTMLRKDKEVNYAASIGGQKVDAIVTLREAAVTRLTLLEQTQKSTGRNYFIVTGVMQPVTIDIDLMLDGERVNIIDVFHRLACASAGADITKEAFMLNAQKIGLRFNTQPLFFQQFGASFDAYKNFIEVFKAEGATDVISRIAGNTGRIKAAYELKPGLPVTAFELGTVDRTKSARYAHDGVGQGFLNLVDAQFEQFTRILGLRKSARLKMTEAENISDEAKIAALKNSANLDMKMSRMATSNWGGAQRRLVQAKNGSFIDEPMYDPVNAPCGRFTVLTSNGEVEADFWTNNTVQNVSDPTVAVEPF